MMTLLGIATGLLIFPAIYVAAAMSSSLGIGIRHVLPVFPFLVLLAAGAGVFFFRRRPWLPGSRGERFYAPLLDREPDATIGHSIHVYRIEEPWWSQ